MKRMSFLGSVGVALALSLLGGAAFAGLGTLLSAEVAFKWVIAGLAAAYIGHLLVKAEQKTGRLVVLAAWLGCTVAAWMSAPHVGVLIAVQVLSIWLVRSLYFHSSVMAALLDLALNALALGAAVWAAGESGSVFMTLWCFFLVQSLCVFVPSDFPRAPAADGRLGATDPFVAAHRGAEEAVRKLVNQS